MDRLKSEHEAEIVWRNLRKLLTMKTHLLVVAIGALVRFISLRRLIDVTGGRLKYHDPYPGFLRQRKGEVLVQTQDKNFRYSHNIPHFNII